MKKIYSLLLTAAFLLVGTNVWADEQPAIEIIRDNAPVDTVGNLHEAFKVAQDGDLLQLLGDITVDADSAVWFGELESGSKDPESENYYADHDRSITLDLQGHTYIFNGNPRGKDSKGNWQSYVCIAFTRGKLTIKSTGGDGEIKATGDGEVEVIRVYGTYLKIDAKENTPYTHLVVEENVKITSETQNAITIEVPQEGQTDSWNWNKANYPLDYSCRFSPIAQQGVSNGVRLDIYGKLTGMKYGLKPSGNMRLGREFWVKDGNSYRRLNEGEKYVCGKNVAAFTMIYDVKDTKTKECYKPGTTQTGSSTADCQECGYSKTLYTYSEGGGYEWGYNDSVYSPYIHIHPSARLVANNPNKTSAVGFYAAGYARTLIEGYCEGSTGVYAKAGDVEINNATITSNYEGQYNPAKAGVAGEAVKAGGSAIVIDSNDGWTGNISLEIGGDTHVSTNHGYAIDERVTDSTKTNVNYLTITGGTFDGGQVPVVTPNAQDPNKNDTTWVQGTMYVSQPTLDAHHRPDTITTITILGAEIHGETNQIGEGEGQVTLAEFVGGQGNTHITYVEDEQGNVAMVVSQGAAPATNPEAEYTDWDYIAGAAADSVAAQKDAPSFAWTLVDDNENAQILSGNTVILDELQINSGSALKGNQQLTIHDGATLQVERLIMNAYARIIVEAGGKLIVKGTQGISAPSINNILLKNEENKPAVFLFNPAVSSNKHPNGTVEFTSKGYKVSSTNFAWQKFGVPTQTGELAGISIENDYATVFAKFNYAAATPEWEVIGYLNVDPSYSLPELNLADMNQAFEYYQMEHSNSNVGTKVTFEGKLVGNDCPAPVIRPNFWNGYANSYSAPIDAEALLTLIPAPADKAFYLYEQDNVTKQFSWVAQSMMHKSDIQPMQPFLIRNPKADATTLPLNYGAAVYTPATTNNAPGAPARHIANDMTKVEFIVRGTNGVDHVIVAQDAQFTAEFDNGYDVAKYMNDEVNMYVSAGEKMAIYATDDIENTYLGFQTVKGGKYTIEFANVQGEELTLIDLDNNASVVMVEGNKYEFTADADSKNDYRFKIVSTFNAPTAIENTEAAKSAKGIYTITGQYVGEMNVWNTLPAGIYVVNGEKLVK